MLLLLAVFVGSVGFAGSSPMPAITPAPTSSAPSPDVPLSAPPVADDGLPETSIRYDIDARIEPSTGDLDGTVRLQWTYAGPETLTEVPIHLYLNGFSSLASTWVEGASALRDFDLEGMADTYDDPWGYSDLGVVSQDGAPCGVRFVQPDDGNPADRSLAMVSLATPLQPGDTLSLELTFDARLPVPIARTGCHRVRRYCHAGQWFPKLAFYDAEGHFGPPGFVAQQFHGPTEFFAPFADYRVSIDAPSDVGLVATGRRVSERADDDRQHVVYAQRAVHDFAFVLGPDLVIDSAPYQPAGGGPEVLLTVVTQPETSAHTEPMRQAAELSLDVLSTRVGPYAWSSLTVVEPPMAAAQTAGMEYQTLVTGMVGDPLLDTPPLDRIGLGTVTIAHEIAHNWFQGMIATNEVTDAHLDEGMTRYWEHQITLAWIDRYGAPDLFGLTSEPAARSRRSGRRLIDHPQAQVTRPSWLLASGTHGAQIYGRPALLFTTAARRHGQGEVDALFAAWFERWRFGHPHSEDLIDLVRTHTSGQLRALLIEGLTNPRFPDYRVDEADTSPWAAALGRVQGPDGPVTVDPDNRDAHTDDRLGLDRSALESDGRVTLEVRSPGTVRGARIIEGGVQRLEVTPKEGRAGAGDDATFHVSEVRISGPSWDHLPVVVRFTFGDGVVLDVPWDGRDPWRSYRFVRPGELLSVHIDPECTLALEGPVHDNMVRLEADKAVVSPLAGWFTRLAQWAMVNAGVWL